MLSRKRTRRLRKWMKDNAKKYTKKRKYNWRYSAVPSSKQHYFQRSLRKSEIHKDLKMDMRTRSRMKFLKRQHYTYRLYPNIRGYFYKEREEDEYPDGDIRNYDGTMTSPYRMLRMMYNTGTEDVKRAYNNLSGKAPTWNTPIHEKHGKTGTDNTQPFEETDTTRDIQDILNKGMESYMDYKHVKDHSDFEIQNIEAAEGSVAHKRLTESALKDISEAKIRSLTDLGFYAGNKVLDAARNYVWDEIEDKLGWNLGPKELPYAYTGNFPIETYWHNDRNYRGPATKMFFRNKDGPIPILTKNNQWIKDKLAPSNNLYGPITFFPLNATVTYQGDVSPLDQWNWYRHGFINAINTEKNNTRTHSMNPIHTAKYIANKVNNMIPSFPKFVAHHFYNGVQNGFGYVHNKIFNDAPEFPGYVEKKEENIINEKL